MRRESKRLISSIFSIMICLTVVLGCFSVPVKADDPEVLVDGATVDDGTLQKAIANVLNTGAPEAPVVIQLQRDISSGIHLCTWSGYNTYIRIDLNGHTWQLQNPAGVLYSSPFAMTSEGDHVEITNGTITYTGSDFVDLLSIEHGYLTLSDVTINASSVTYSDPGSVIKVASDATLTVNSGTTIEQTGTADRLYAVFTSGGTLNVNGGNIIGKNGCAIGNWYGDVTINDGNIQSNSMGSDLATIYNCKNLTINGGTIQNINTNETAVTIYAYGNTVDITGGSILGAGKDVILHRTASDSSTTRHFYLSGSPTISNTGSYTGATDIRIYNSSCKLEIGASGISVASPIKLALKEDNFVYDSATRYEDYDTSDSVITYVTNWGSVMGSAVYTNAFAITPMPGWTVSVPADGAYAGMLVTTPYVIATQPTAASPTVVMSTTDANAQYQWVKKELDVVTIDSSTITAYPAAPGTDIGPYGTPVAGSVNTFTSEICAEAGGYQGIVFMIDPSTLSSDFLSNYIAGNVEETYEILSGASGILDAQVSNGTTVILGSDSFTAKIIYNMFTDVAGQTTATLTTTEPGTYYCKISYPDTYKGVGVLTSGTIEIGGGTPPAPPTPPTPPTSPVGDPGSYDGGSYESTPETTSPTTDKTEEKKSEEKKTEEKKTEQKVKTEEEIRLEETKKTITIEDKEVKEDVLVLKEVDISKEVKESDGSNIILDTKTEDANVKGIELTGKAAEDIAEVLKSDDNEKSELTLRFDKYEITFDQKTIEKIAATGEKSSVIRIVAEDKGMEVLTKEQKDTLNGLAQESAKSEGEETPTLVGVFEAYVECDGERIHDFEGGEATVGVDFDAKEFDTNHLFVEYLKEDGTTERHVTWYSNKKLYYSTTHFSDYIIVYDGVNRNGYIEYDTYLQIRKVISLGKKFNLVVNTEDGLTTKYTSSDPAVASVDAKGVITANAEGMAIVTVECGEYKAVVNVVVKSTGSKQKGTDKKKALKKNINVAALTIYKKIVIGTDSKLYFENADNAEISYTVADSSILKVTNKNALHGITPGETYVDVKVTKQGISHMYRILVTVE